MRDAAESGSGSATGSGSEGAGGDGSASGALALGTRVVVDGRLAGTLRFAGATQFAGGEWLGVELDGPHGRNDGSVHGVRYFHTLHNRSRTLTTLRSLPRDRDVGHYGLFVRADRVARMPRPITPSTLARQARSGEFSASLRSLPAGELVTSTSSLRFLTEDDLVSLSSTADASTGPLDVAPHSLTSAAGVPHSRARRDIAADAPERAQAARLTASELPLLDAHAGTFLGEDVSKEELFVRIVELEETLEVMRETAAAADAQRIALLWRIVELADNDAHASPQPEDGASAAEHPTPFGADTPSASLTSLTPGADLTHGAVTPREHHLMRVVMTLKKRIAAADEELAAARARATQLEAKVADREDLARAMRERYTALLAEHEAVGKVKRSLARASDTQAGRLAVSLQRALTAKTLELRNVQQELERQRGELEEANKLTMEAALQITALPTDDNAAADERVVQLRDEMERSSVDAHNRELIVTELDLRLKRMTSELATSRSRVAALLDMLRHHVSDEELVERGVLDSHGQVREAWDPRAGVHSRPTDLDHEIMQLDAALRKHRRQQVARRRAGWATALVAPPPAATDDGTHANAGAEGGTHVEGTPAYVELDKSRVMPSLRNSALASMLAGIDAAKHRSAVEKRDLRNESWLV